MMHELPAMLCAALAWLADDIRASRGISQQYHTKSLRCMTPHPQACGQTKCTPGMESSYLTSSTKADGKCPSLSELAAATQMPHNDYQQRQLTQMQAPSPLASMGQHAAPMPHGEAYQPPLHQQQQHQPPQGQPLMDAAGRQMGQDMPPGQLPMVMPRNSAGEDVAAAALVNLVQVAPCRCFMLVATIWCSRSAVLHALNIPH